MVYILRRAVAWALTLLTALQAATVVTQGGRDAVNSGERISRWCRVSLVVGRLAFLRIWSAGLVQVNGVQSVL